MNHSSECLSYRPIETMQQIILYFSDVRFKLLCGSLRWCSCTAPEAKCQWAPFYSHKMFWKIMITFYFSVSRAELVGPTASQNSSYVTLKLQVMWLVMMVKMIIMELSLKAVKFWISEYSNLKNPLGADFFYWKHKYSESDRPKDKTIVI